MSNMEADYKLLMCPVEWAKKSSGAYLDKFNSIDPASIFGNGYNQQNSTNPFSGNFGSQGDMFNEFANLMASFFDLFGMGDQFREWAGISDCQERNHEDSCEDDHGCDCENSTSSRSTRESSSKTTPKLTDELKEDIQEHQTQIDNMMDEARGRAKSILGEKASDEAIEEKAKELAAERIENFEGFFNAAHPEYAEFAKKRDKAKAKSEEVEKDAAAKFEAECPQPQVKRWFNLDSWSFVPQTRASKDTTGDWERERQHAIDHALDKTDYSKYLELEQSALKD